MSPSRNVIKEIKIPTGYKSTKLPSKFEVKKSVKPSTPIPIKNTNIKENTNNTSNSMIDSRHNDFYQTFNAESQSNTIRNLNDKNKNHDSHSQVQLGNEISVDYDYSHQHYSTLRQQQFDKHDDITTHYDDVSDLNKIGVDKTIKQSTSTKDSRDYLSYDQYDKELNVGNKNISNHHNYDKQINTYTNNQSDLIIADIN
jgi:hypothetical protein